MTCILDWTGGPTSPKQKPKCTGGLVTSTFFELDWGLVLVPFKMDWWIRWSLCWDFLDFGTCILLMVCNNTEYWLKAINFKKSGPLFETLANIISMMFTNVQKDKISKHVKNSRLFNSTTTIDFIMWYSIEKFFNVRLRNSWTCTSHKGQKNFMALGPCQKTNFYFRWYYFIDLLKDSIIILWQTLDSFCVVRGVIT